MRGRVSEPARARDGTYTVTITGLPMEALEAFDRLKAGDAEITIKPFKLKRSLDANRFCWALVGKITAELQTREPRSGWTRTEVYRKAIREVGGISDTVRCDNTIVERVRRRWESNGLGWMTEVLTVTPSYTDLVLYAGSSAYDSAEMARLINVLIQDAESLGIPTIDDTEKEKLFKNIKGE